MVFKAKFCVDHEFDIKKCEWRVVTPVIGQNSKWCPKSQKSVIWRPFYVLLNIQINCNGVKLQFCIIFIIMNHNLMAFSSKIQWYPVILSKIGRFWTPSWILSNARGKDSSYGILVVKFVIYTKFRHRDHQSIMEYE